MRRNVLLHVLKRKAAIRQDITIRGAHTSLIRGNHTYSHKQTLFSRPDVFWYKILNKCDKLDKRERTQLLKKKMEIFNTQATTEKNQQQQIQVAFTTHLEKYSKIHSHSHNNRALQRLHSHKQETKPTNQEAATELFMKWRHKLEIFALGKRQWGKKVRLQSFFV